MDGSDYINATWLMGYQRLKEFVITQHPESTTIMDFWEMLFTHNAQTVVLLSAVDEQAGFPQFWPNQNEDFENEHWKVRFLEERVHSGLVTMEMEVQSLQDDGELPVRLVIAPGWPDALPALATTLSLVSLLHETHQTNTDKPLVVVDKHGGTEAGMFCLLTALKSQLEYEKSVDPFLYFKLYHNRRPGLWNSQDDLLFIYRALESHIGSQFSLNTSSSSSCDLAGLSEPVISPVPNTTVIPSSLPSLTVIPLTLPSVISSTLPTSLSLHQPCDLIPTSMMGCASDLTPPQTPQQTQASIISAAAITASNCLSSPQSCMVMSPTLQQQALGMQHQHCANTQPIIQPLSSPADPVSMLQQSGTMVVTSPVNTLGRSHTNPSQCLSPLASNGGILSPLNTICSPGLAPMMLPTNGCPGNGYPGTIIADTAVQCNVLSGIHGEALNSNARVSPEGREDTPLTGEGLPLEMTPMPPV